jgi:hypothetical protein
MTAKKDPQFASLVDTRNPDSVLGEIRTILDSALPGFDFDPVNAAHKTIVKLFDGVFPSYRKCNTKYHDLQHTQDVMLAMTRLVHGAILQGVSLDRHHVTLGLLATLFHDVGYIQRNDDQQGTGAKYTMVHIERGIQFMEDYLAHNGFVPRDFTTCQCMILCSGFNISLHDIPFDSEQSAMLGKMLGSADLLGQMADRAYLEKLLFLYHEFKEGNVGEYATEVDLLKSTLSFYGQTEVRLITELDNVKRYMIEHFKARWDINKDLYAMAIQKNRSYLEYILKNHENEHRDFLRRDNIVKRLNDDGL